MSYTVRDFQSISGTVSGSYDYPASENGGSGSITLDWEEGVDIQVTVNDDPFQSSVRSCKQNIDLMTASVVATEVAQLASKAEAAKKISAGVVKGFFGLIQSEINQQMTELSASLGPKIQEINNISTRCLALKQQMEADFHRIRDRYIRLFGDLDQELNKRIRNLDRHAFSLRQISADPTGDSAKSKHVTTPMVSGQETHVVQTQLLTHSIRQGALSIIASANKSIIAGERLNKDMQTIREDIETEIQQQLLIPFVFVDVGLLTTCKGISNVKTLPFPGNDSTYMVPPSISTYDFARERPNPVPPYFLEWVNSTCLKRSKITPCNEGSIPIPVSLILNISRLFLFETLIPILPFEVNLKAFPMMLFKICLSLTGSLSIVTMSLGRLLTNDSLIFF